MNDTFRELHPKIVLGIAAHPDDLDFGAAGTMAKFAQAGAAVHYLILTDGSKGSDDPNMSHEQLIELRENEQRAAVEAIGGKSVTFLHYPDGELEVSMQLKKDIVTVVRKIKPEVMITMDPSMVYSSKRGIINHPDHRAAGQAALDAIFPLARDHLTFPELLTQGYKPHKTATVLLINFDKTDFCIDVTDSYKYKEEALKAHASQISDIDATLTWIRSFAEEAGNCLGCPLAESFIRIDVA